MNKFNFATLVVLLGVITVPLYLRANDNVIGNKNHIWWINAGCGYVHTDDPYGISTGVTGSYMSGMHQFTFRLMHMNALLTNIYGGSPDEYAFDIGLLYGLCWRPTLILKEQKERSPVWLSAAVSLSGGIAPVFGIKAGKLLDTDQGMFDHYHETERFSKIGFPLQLELRLIPRDKLSFGIIGLANLNSIESFYSAWIGIQYGMLRLKTDSLRASQWNDLPAEIKTRKSIPRILLGLAILGSGTVSLVSHIRFHGAQGTADDYLELRNGSYSDADYKKYDDLYQEEKEIIHSRRIARNIFAALSGASLLGLTVIFEL